MREIKTIASDRYEKMENGLLKHVGMITGKEAFNQLKKHLEEVGLLPDEYFIPTYFQKNMDEELPAFRSAICHTDWGGNEGIYVDIELMYIENRNRKFHHFATGKTLDESGEAFLRMSRIAAECSIMLNGRGEIVRVPESSYENSSTLDAVKTPLSVQLESAAARVPDIPSIPGEKEKEPELSQTL